MSKLLDESYSTAEEPPVTVSNPWHRNAGSTATPSPDQICVTCSSSLPAGDKSCVHCVQNTRYQDDLTLDLTDVGKGLSLLQLNNFSLQNFETSPLNLSPEIFLPKMNRSDSLECSLHHAPCYYWCYTCTNPVCLSCVGNQHSTLVGHKTGPISEAQTTLLSQLHTEMRAVRKLHCDTKLLTGSQRDFLLKVLESCSNLELLMREELSLLDKQQAANGVANEEDATQFLLNKISFQLGGLSGPEEVTELLRELHAERVRLQHRQQQLAMQLSLNRIIGSSNQVLEPHTFRQAIQGLRFPGRGGTNTGQILQQCDPVALLANVCNARLYTKQLLATSLLSPEASPMTGLLSPGIHSNFPRFFFDIEVDGIVEGRVVLETRPDVAPKMSKNFAALCTNDKGFGYNGCQVFQCWGGESCIAGDFECNSGRGGRSIFHNEPFFMPDDSRLPCVRAAIGMRRTQKKHHSQGLVGSQFRILLRDMPFFTGVFGHVIHGLEHVERISFLGDHQGFPRKLITIANCGQLS